MFDLLDESEPPPRFSFSALVALVASAGAAWWEATLLWDVARTGSAYFLLAILVAPIALFPPALLASLICAVAIYFKQGRWAFIGFGLMGLPYALFVVYLVVDALVRQ